MIDGLYYGKNIIKIGKHFYFKIINNVYTSDKIQKRKALISSRISELNAFFQGITVGLINNCKFDISTAKMIDTL